MSRRVLIVVSAVLLGAAAPGGASTPPPPAPGTQTTPAAKPPAKPQRSWADAQIRLVVAHGLMAPDVASFRPDDPLTRGALSALVAGLTGRVPAPVANPAAPVTIAGLDAKLVRGLGLGPAAGDFLRSARSVGLTPPGRFGTEVTARLLGLRYNHPAADDGLELRPQDTATRAEAAYSAARVLRFRGGEIPRGRRISFAKLRPADVVFFGLDGPRSRPAQVDHMGIYVGGGWFVHSSSNGVALTQLQGWYRDRFAWGGRPPAGGGLPPATLPPVP